MAPPEGGTGMRLTQAQDATEARMKTQARRASTARAAETAAAALALGATFAHEFSALWQASQSVQSGCICCVI
jgi:D-alanyl-D-alanine carboxypeptidase